MKKKFSVLLLAIVVLPLLALFGCNEVSSYPVYVFSSYLDCGSVAGAGTYKEGETVTLLANAKDGSNFICWVFQNSTELSNGEIFNITNETDTAQKIKRSTLSFVMTSDRKGKYTAIFSDTKMMYAKLDSMYLTTDLTAEPKEDDATKEAILSESLHISQGMTNSNLVTVFENSEVDFKDSTLISFKDINQVLKLSTDVEQLLKVELGTKTLRASLTFQTNKDWVENSNYSYKVSYENGTYKIVFSFDSGENQTLYLVLNYHNLTA